MATDSPDLEKARAMVRELIERNAEDLRAENNRESLEKEAARLLVDLNSPGQAPRVMGVAHAYYPDLYESVDPNNPPLEWRCEVLIRHSSTNPAAFEALRRKACTMLMASEPMPSNLACWAAGVLGGDIKAPSRKGSGQVLTQDLVVLALCRLQVEFGIRPTRNDATDRPSGCDIVSEALEGIGISKNFEAVRQIWKRRKEEREMTMEIVRRVCGTR